jgi:DNA polymerase elongation subunit (family B)
MIIQQKTLNRILFLDIETVSSKQDFNELTDTLKHLWMRKSKQFLADRSQEVTEELASKYYKEKAGIFAEFGKIVCISIGYLFKQKNKPSKLRIKSLFGDEVDILKSFNEVLNTHYDDLETDFLCGHNIKEFDIPFICRRNIVHGLDLPRLLNIAGKKPWQLSHLLDTMELWRFGDYKNYTSLALLSGALDIPSPKDDIDGSMVGHVFWEEDDIERIVTYCEKDVLTVAQVAMKFAGLPLLEEEHVEIVKQSTKLKG